MRIFYVDDSGNEAFTTFSAVAVPARGWSTALGRWLAWRRHLHSVHAVDARRRLHATDWVAGRGRPSDDPEAVLNRSKPVRWQEYVAALHALAGAPDLQVLTVLRPGKRDARESQWPQIADFVAYAAFQHVARSPARAFMWHWYEQCLGECIVRDPSAEDGIRGLPAAADVR
jgi:hypothetical protein